MNKTLAISAIVLVAVIMGMSSIVPVMAEPPVEGEHEDHPTDCTSAKALAEEKSGRMLIGCTQ